MVRGRRKGMKTCAKMEGGSLNNDQNTKMSKGTKFSRGVNGRLSHASPILQENERITHYFHPVPSPTLPYDRENSQVPEKTSVDSKPEIEVITIVSDSEERVIPHRISYDPEINQSPSSGIPHLRIAYTPKKPTKTRRRLNPSQAGNQQISVPKRACCGKQAGEDHTLKEYFPVRRSERKTKGTVLQEKQHKIEAAILSRCEEGLEVHQFESKGRGIVTTRLFCKGEFVVEYVGELIDMAKAKEREKKYAQDQNTGCYMYYFRHKNVQYCVDATAENGSYGRLVNHSRNGNLLTKTVEISSKPHLVLIAKEDIAAGEEVTYDYGDRSKESIRFHPWLLS